MTTTERDQQIIAAYQAGQTMNAIARAHRLSSPTVKAALLRNNIPLRPQYEHRAPLQRPVSFRVTPFAADLAARTSDQTSAGYAKQIQSDLRRYYQLENLLDDGLDPLAALRAVGLIP